MHRVLFPALAVASVSFGGELKLGKPLALKETISIAEVNAQAEKYVDKVVQVRGTVTEVCQMMGCWMALADSGQTIRIKVNDGDIVFPKEAVGKSARAEGKLVRLKLTRQQAVARAKHEAEETGRKFDAAAITGPITIYQIAGTGAVVGQ
jgi:hypothetical protein